VIQGDHDDKPDWTGGLCNCLSCNWKPLFTKIQNRPVFLGLSPKYLPTYLPTHLLSTLFSPLQNTNTTYKI
jgi:hypothetical protein